MKRSKLGGGELLALLLLSTAAAGAEHAPLRVAMSGHYMPLHGPGSKGMMGLEAELALALGRELGREVEFIDTRRRFKLGTIEAVAAGKVDLGINSITPTPERAQQVDFTRPYLELTYRLAGLRGLSSRELPGYAGRVAVPRGEARQAVENAMPRATVVDCESVRECMEMVEQKQADSVAGEDVGLQLAARDSPLVVSEAAFGRCPLAIATPKGSAAAIDTALEKLRPTLEQLQRTWRPGEPYLPDAQHKLLQRLPRRLIGLRQLGNEWVRPRYCHSQPGDVSIEKGSNTVWWMHVYLAQDTDSYQLQSIQEVGEQTWRIKAVMHSREAIFFQLGPGEESGTWRCEPCRSDTSTFTTQAHARQFRAHDFDAEVRDENGECGPP